MPPNPRAPRSAQVPRAPGTTEGVGRGRERGRAGPWACASVVQGAATAAARDPARLHRNMAAEMGNAQPGRPVPCPAAARRGSNAGNLRARRGPLRDALDEGRLAGRAPPDGARRVRHGGPGQRGERLVSRLCGEEGRTPFPSCGRPHWPSAESTRSLPRKLRRTAKARRPWPPYSDRRGDRTRDNHHGRFGALQLYEFPDGNGRRSRRCFPRWGKCRASSARMASRWLLSLVHRRLGRKGQELIQAHARPFEDNRPAGILCPGRRLRGHRPGDGEEIITLVTNIWTRKRSWPQNSLLHITSAGRWNSSSTS